MSIRSSTATVYHGGGRRWFSMYAAERAEAKRIISKRCECDYGDSVTPTYRCRYHNMDPVKFQRLVRLLIVMFVRKEPRQ